MLTKPQVHQIHHHTLDFKDSSSPKNRLKRYMIFLILWLIDRVRALKSNYVCGRNFERVWNCEMVHVKDEIHDSSK